MRNQISKPNNHGLNRFKKAGVIIALVVLLFPGLSWADEAKKDSTTFKARVVEVLQVVEKTRDDGTKFTQQDLKLLGLEGDWKDKEIVYHGVDDIEVANSLVYKIGDKIGRAHV